MCNNNTIGERIANYRKKMGLSQKELAQELGISSSKLCNWEKNKNFPKITSLNQICSYLNISIYELLGVKQPAHEFTPEEENIIRAYRHKTDLQKAVKILLNITNY